MADQGLYGIYWHGSCTNTEAFFWDANHTAWPEGKHWQAPHALDYDTVDAGIRPLVRAVNATGWMETIQSCEGHPNDDNNYCAHVELWVRVPSPEGLGPLFDWVQRAIKIRRDISIVYKDGRLIDIEFVGHTRYGYYFVVFGRFVSAVENGRIITALTQALA